MRLNTAERKVAKQLRADGWRLYRAGWPDFLCVRTVNGVTEVKGVEVKCGSFTSRRQVLMHSALRKGGIATDVVNTGPYIYLTFTKRELELIEALKTRFGIRHTGQIFRMALRALAVEKGVAL